MANKSNMCFVFLSLRFVLSKIVSVHFQVRGKPNDSYGNNRTKQFRKRRRKLIRNRNPEDCTSIKKRSQTKINRRHFSIGLLNVVMRHCDPNLESQQDLSRCQQDVRQTLDVRWTSVGRPLDVRRTSVRHPSDFCRGQASL